jgi:hypothetical protein
VVVTFAKDFLRLRYRSLSFTEPCFAGVLRESVRYEIRMGPIMRSRAAEAFWRGQNLHPGHHERLPFRYSRQTQRFGRCGSVIS